MAELPRLQRPLAVTSSRNTTQVVCVCVWRPCLGWYDDHLLRDACLFYIKPHPERCWQWWELIKGLKSIGSLKCCSEDFKNDRFFKNRYVWTKTLAQSCTTNGYLWFFVEAGDVPLHHLLHSVVGVLLHRRPDEQHTHTQATHHTCSPCYILCYFWLLQYTHTKRCIGSKYIHSLHVHVLY